MYLSRTAGSSTSVPIVSALKRHRVHGIMNQRFQFCCTQVDSQSFCTSSIAPQFWSCILRRAPLERRKLFRELVGAVVAEAADVETALDSMMA